VIADSGEVLHATAADQDDGVFLEVMADARDISAHLDAIGEAHAATLRSAELGFLGVVVYTRTQTPRF